MENRRVGRPNKRWSDDLRKYIYAAVYRAGTLPSIVPRLDNVQWIEHAKDEAAWAQLEKGYCEESG